MTTETPLGKKIADFAQKAIDLHHEDGSTVYGSVHTVPVRLIIEEQMPIAIITMQTPITLRVMTFVPMENVIKTDEQIRAIQHAWKAIGYGGGNFGYQQHNGKIYRTFNFICSV